MVSSPVKVALEDLLRAHRLGSEAPPLRGERRLAPLPTGLPDVDELLGGGFPRGQVSEVHGRASSGRTAVVQAAVAHALRRGALAAWVDPADRFDPAAAAECGLELARLLWLRGASSPARAVSAAGTLLGAGLFELVVLDVAGVPPSELGRLPHTTWLRLQRAASSVPSALVLLAEAHAAHGPAGVSLALSSVSGAWSGHGAGRLLTGASVEATCGRRRSRLELQALA